MLTEEIQATQRRFTRKFFLIFISIIILIIVLGAYGAYRVYTWDANRKALAEKDRIARMKQAPQVTITLIEGWTSEEIYKYLESKKLGTVAEYKKAEQGIDFSKYAFLTGVPKTTPLEGFLFPDTYRVLENSTPAEILHLLLQTFGKKWEQVLGEAKTPQSTNLGTLTISSFPTLKPLTFLELVTLASIVEKETGRFGENASSERLLEERRTVAGVFYNRLVIGQALESDATVGFVTKSGRHSATLEDLQVNSPYNTYKNPGLPPGPIASPSYASLYAVLYPIKSDYYFFLHKQPSGEIVYSKTFAEHLANKNKFLK